MKRERRLAGCWWLATANRTGLCVVCLDAVPSGVRCAVADTHGGLMHLECLELLSADAGGGRQEGRDT